MTSSRMRGRYLGNIPLAIGMTSTFPARLLDLLPGQPYPSTTTYQGLLYPGEVLFAEQWDSSWGTVLRGHEFFRIVFLGTHQQVPPENLQDSMIAVCLPSTGGRREQERKPRYSASPLRCPGIPLCTTSALWIHRYNRLKSQSTTMSSPASWLF